MNDNSTKIEVLDILLSFFGTAGVDTNIIETADLIDDLGMDSITFISIIVELETHFNIVIPYEHMFLDHFRNADNIIAIVEKELFTKVEILEER